MSSNGGILGSTSISAVGCCSSISCVDGVDGVADVVDGVTFAASHAAFSALVSFCPGLYHFPVSPLYNFLGVTWNCSEMVEVLSLVLNNSFCRTAWIIAARHQIGCLGGRTANTGWNGLAKHWFMPISSFVFGVLNIILKTSSSLGCTGVVVVISVPRGIKNVS